MSDSLYLVMTLLIGVAAAGTHDKLKRAMTYLTNQSIVCKRNVRLGFAARCEAWLCLAVKRLSI